MPSDPVTITPSYTPSSPSAPGAATGSYAAGAPSAPLAITPGFSAGAPTAPAAVTGAAAAPVTGFVISGTIDPDINVFVGQVGEFEYNSMGAPVGDVPPENPYVVAIRGGGLWEVFRFVGFETSRWWGASEVGNEASPDLVPVWVPRDDEIGTPVFTPASGHAWPVIISPAPVPATTSPEAVTSNFVPGAPTAPRAATASWSAGAPEVPAAISANGPPGAPANAPAAASSNYTPATPTAPPAITT